MRIEINYFDAIVELNKTDNTEREIPIEVSNKYRDVKYTSFLTSIGITKLVDGNYQLSDYIKDKYLADSVNCPECQMFFKSLAQKKEDTIAELYMLIKSEVNK